MENKNEFNYANFQYQFQSIKREESLEENCIDSLKYTKLYIGQCFDKYNKCQEISNQELQDMIDYAERALHYLKIRGSAGILLQGIWADISSLKQMQNKRLLDAK